jgi:hypothetical protein
LTNNTRPTFYLDGDKEKPIKAGGVLFYRINRKKKDIEFLLIRNRNQYEDFGGRTDSIDKEILDTVCREVDEESNNIFKKDVIQKQLTTAPIYSGWSKYIIYLLELKNNHYNVRTKKFGKKELHDNIPRTMHWIKYSVYKTPEFQKKLNFRLKIKELYTMLDEIYDKYFPNVDTNASDKDTSSEPNSDPIMSDYELV